MYPQMYPIVYPQNTWMPKNACGRVWMLKQKKPLIDNGFFGFFGSFMDMNERVRGGAGGIRTRGGLLTHTRFPGVRLKPLIHRSVKPTIVAGPGAGS